MYKVLEYTMEEKEERLQNEKIIIIKEGKNNFKNFHKWFLCLIDWK